MEFWKLDIPPTFLGGEVSTTILPLEERNVGCVSLHFPHNISLERLWSVFPRTHIL